MNENMPQRRQPKVSVIIPVYCVEKYIRECVDSVLAQTFTDYEIILVDDGSSDRCGEICDEYAKKDARVTVVHKTNGGLSDARNFGMAQASGELIYFLDGDDWIDDKLLECVTARMELGYDLVVFNYYTAYSDRNSEEISHLPGEINIDNEENRLDFFFGTFLKSKIGWSAWDRIFRKSLIDKYKITFADNKRIFMEDMFFSCCYCAYAKKICCIEDRLIFYRQREDSIMHTDGLEHNFNRVNEFGKELLNFYSVNKCASLLDVFPQIYYTLIRNNFWKYNKQTNADIVKAREVMVNGIEDLSFFKHQMKSLKNQNFISESAYSKQEFKEMKSNAKFFLDGNEKTFKIRNKINNLR